MSGIGWISIHRKIQECEIWLDDEPFDRRSAWIDLLLLVNHEDKRTLFNGKMVAVKRGQRITSVRKLADRWKWSPKKTLNYLRLLEDEKMIVKESDNKKTLITIVNYEEYQNVETQKKHKRNTEETQRKHSLPTNNKDNNENNNNNILSSLEDESLSESSKRIIEYLNEKTGSRFKYESKATQKMIKARLDDGFTVDDFKTVIDNKCASWLKDTKMSQYLRPETLFRPSHFESYLNEKPQQSEKIEWKI